METLQPDDPRGWAATGCCEGSAREAWGASTSHARPVVVLKFLRAGGTLYGASAMDGAFALDAKSGWPRWVRNNNKGLGEPWQVALSGNRLLATHGYEIYALPAV
jgi:hypothetical protein